MALTPEIRVSQGNAGVVTGGSSPNLQTSQAFAHVVGNLPTDEIQNSQSLNNVVTSGGSPAMQVSQSFLTIVARGRIDDPKVRVWTYTLDGHDYYVLRLGNSETLVYDTYSEEWSVFGSDGTNLWKAFTGINWVGGNNVANSYGSNVIVGDHGNGSLYFLDPEQYKDDSSFGTEDQTTFERIFQAQLQKRSYDFEKCFAVELLGSIGKMDQSDLTDITLYYSDDQGITYINAGTVSITNEDYSKRVDWRSLGSFSAPGRMFKIIDNGALQRIDSLTADTDRERG